MYRIYKNIHSFAGGFKILIKSDIFKMNFMAHFLDDQGGITCMMDFVDGHIPYEFQRNLIIKTQVLERKLTFCQFSGLSVPLLLSDVMHNHPFQTHPVFC